MTSARATVGELASTCDEARLIGPGSAVVTGITYDSREVRQGYLFAALRGADLDGHAFVADAQGRGAAALLVEHEVDSSLPQIVVSDSRAALAAVAAAYYGNPSHEIGVIGITGTDGKTTTSFIVDHVLRSLGLKTGLIGTIAIRAGEQAELHASRQTTPESNDVQRYLRKMADAGTDWAVLEATSHGLAMHRVDHVRFQIGAVTNITHEHLDYHGSVEQYRRAKAILLERVASAQGRVVLNADDPGAMAVAPFAEGAAVLYYGVEHPTAEVNARHVRSTATGSTFTVETRDFGSVDVTLPLIGEFNVANALCATAISLCAGCVLDEVADALRTAPPVPGRMTPVAMGQPFSVVVDYAHTPDSLEKVLRLLRRLHPHGKLIAVFGSAGERDVEKRPLQGAVSARLADITVVTSEDPRFEDADRIIEQIAAGAEDAGAIRDQTLYTRTDRREAIALALALAEPGDCILLAGKGHEGSIIWGREKRPWDEAQTARELLEERGFRQPQS